MIFKNTLRLVMSNFSSVWKLLLYQIICIALTVLTCGFILHPIVLKLAEANVFADLLEVLQGFFTTAPTDLATSLEAIGTTAMEVLSTNVQFKFNYVFLFVWMLFIFPFLLNLSDLALGDVMYGYMTSRVKYGFTGRFVKNIGKSALYSLIHTLVMLVLNAVMVGGSILIVKIATLGNVWFLLLDALLLGFFMCFSAFKETLFCCWMPAIAVFDENVFKAFAHNFKSFSLKFWNIFSNMLLLTLLSWVINLLFAVLTMGVSLVVTVPLTAFSFVVLQMVGFFNTQGMKYYVYPDLIVSPKTFEEKDSLAKLKYLV